MDKTLAEIRLAIETKQKDSDDAKKDYEEKLLALNMSQKDSIVKINDTFTLEILSSSVKIHSSQVSESFPISDIELQLFFDNLSNLGLKVTPKIPNPL